MKEKSQEFLEKREFLELQDQYNKIQHDRTMTELEYRRESDRLHHEREKERQRIKSAEIRKSQQRRSDIEFMKDRG